MVSGAAATLEQGGSTTVSATGEAVGGGGTTITFDLDLSSAPAGDHDLRVVNPDAGTDLLPAALSVLGRRPPATGLAAGSAPALAYNPEDDEYLVAYTVTVSGQRDVRARRFSAATGNPVGPEIEITSPSGDASSSEDQFDPAVAYAPSLDLYIVVTSWSDPNASENPVSVRSQFVDRNGLLVTGQDNAFPLFFAISGTIGRPRIAWNATREEWMVVWAWDASNSADVYYGVYERVFFGSIPAPQEIGSGVLIATTHQSGADMVADGDAEPDLAWSSTSGEYLVCYTFDATEVFVPMQPPPADTGTDVRARFFDGDFSSGPVVKASLANLGDVANKHDRNGSVGFDPSTNRFMVAWDHQAGSGNRDLRAFLVEGTARTRVGSTPTTLEQTSSEDAAQPAVSFDPAPLSGGWLVAHAVAPGGSGTSRVVLARIPPSAAAGSGLGTPAYTTQAPAATGAAYSLPCIARRGAGGEYLIGWTTVGGGLDPVEMRFWR